MAPQNRAGQIEGCGTREELLANFGSQHSCRVGAREGDAPGYRDKQRGNQSDETISNRQHCIGSRRFAQFNALLQCANQQPGDNVDCSDQNRCHRIALVEARCTIHGAVELRLACDRLPPAPCLRFIDKSGIHVGIDGHLLARQRVEGKACSHFGRAHGTVRYNKELDGDKGEKEDEPNNVVPADDKLSESLDHLPCSCGSFRTMK